MSLLNLSHPRLSEDEVFNAFISDLLLNNRTLISDVLEKIDALYPANDTSQGAPFNTGDSLFDRASAFYGDSMFLAPRRLFFEKAALLQPVYGYHFREFVSGFNPLLGCE